MYANAYIHEFHYCSFAVKLDRCAWRCNALNELSNKVYVPNKTEDLNLKMFNMITGINESIKLILCNCKCKLDGKKYDSDQWWNKDKCQCQCTKRHVCEKDYIHLHAVVKNKNI